MQIICLSLVSFHKIFDDLLTETARLLSEGRKVVYPSAEETFILREEPPNPSVKEESQITTEPNRG